MDMGIGDGTMTARDNREYRDKWTLLLVDRVLIGLFFVSLGACVQWNLESQRAATAAQQAERDRVAAAQQAERDRVAAARQAERDRVADERARVRDLTLAFSRVMTEVVTARRSVLSEAVSGFLSELRRTDSSGQVQDRNKLSQLVDDIENEIVQLAAIDSALRESALPFLGCCTPY